MRRERVENRSSSSSTSKRTTATTLFPFSHLSPVPHGPAEQRRQPDPRREVLPDRRRPRHSALGRERLLPLPEQHGSELVGKLARGHRAGGLADAVLEDAGPRRSADLLEALFFFFLGARARRRRRRRRRRSGSSSFGSRSSVTRLRRRVRRLADLGRKPPPLLPCLEVGVEKRLKRFVNKRSPCLEVTTNIKKTHLVVYRSRNVARTHEQNADVERRELDAQ